VLYDEFCVAKNDEIYTALRSRKTKSGPRCSSAPV
jgi:hypothetical protein